MDVHFINTVENVREWIDEANGERPDNGRRYVAKAKIAYLYEHQMYQSALRMIIESDTIDMAKQIAELALETMKECREFEECMDA